MREDNSHILQKIQALKNAGFEVKIHSLDGRLYSEVECVCGRLECFSYRDDFSKEDVVDDIVEHFVSNDEHLAKNDGYSIVEINKIREAYHAI